MIKADEVVTLLGFQLDRHFTFNAHISASIIKARGILFAIKKASKILPKELSKLAYTALARSHLEYCSAVFAGASKTHLDKLETVQRIAARIICGVVADAHAEPLLADLNLALLSERRKNHVLDIIDKITKNSCHDGLLDLINYSQLNSELVMETSRTMIGRKRFSTVAAATYNQFN